MEINKLTYNIYKYLDRLDWKYVGVENSKFILLSPPEKDGFPKGFKLKLPISNYSKDFGNFIDEVIKFIEDNYKTNDGSFKKIIDLNNNLKNRFKGKNEWIDPEFKSKIDKIDKFDPYYPIKTSWK